MTMQGHLLEQPQPTTVDVTDADFEATVIEESKRRPVVVDLWADWCQPCKTLGPILERTAESHGGAFLLAKLDVDANPMVAQALQVQSIPTVVAFKDGQPVDGFIGAYPEPEVQRFVDRLLPSEGDLVAERVASSEGQVDAEVAEGDLRATLEREPDNEQVRLVLARIVLDRGELDEARALVTPLLPNDDAQRLLSEIRVRGWADDPGGSGELGRAKAAAAEGRTREALELLLDRAATDAEAREAMLDIFNVLGEDDPLVGEFRRKLSSALF